MRFALSSAIALCLSLGALPGQGAAGPTPDVRLHRVTTTEHAWTVNAFVLESPSGLVIVDSLFLESDVRKLAAVVRDLGKPVAGILLTHPHVDHTGGVARLRREFGQVPVYATAQTAANVVPLFERAKRQAWVARAFGNDYPTEAVAPDRVVADRETVEIAGMHFRFTDLGAMESENNAIIENVETGTLFSGDATVAHANYYVGEGYSCGALRGLRRLRGLYEGDRMVYSGHYGPQRLGPLLEDNMAQITWLRERMGFALSDPANHTADGSLNEATRARLVAETAARFGGNSDYGFGAQGYASDVNLPGLENEMRTELDTKTPCAD